MTEKNETPISDDESPEASAPVDPQRAATEGGAREDEATAALDAPAAASPGRDEEDDQRDRYLRLAAEFENFRRRMTRESQQAGARARADLVKQTLDALDDLARFAHVDPSTVDAKTVVEGAEMVERKLLKAFGAAGLEVINPEGDSFDPALHEAVSTEPALAAEDDHTVARVYQVGYVFNGQLLRPARVVVRQFAG